MSAQKIRDLEQELEVWKHGPSCWNCGDTGDVHDMVGEWRGKCDCHAAQLIDITRERDKLKTEIAGLKTGYEAYERVNAELTQRIANLELCQTASLGVSGIIKSTASELGFDAAGEDSALDYLIGLARSAAALRAEREDLKEKYEAARDRKNSITALQAENEALRDAAAVSAMRIKELDLLFGRYILAMRAAVIEDEHGKTETAGMDWIFNSLAGPGQLPPEGETDAQAYFDREIVAVDNGMQEVLAFHDQRRAAKSKESTHD